MKMPMDTVCTERLTISPMAPEETRALMEKCRASDPELSRAYRQMLEGCLAHPEAYLWYAPWKICRKATGEMAGDLCFKGRNPEGWVEIGYGILAEYEGRGYATEAVTGMCRWALAQPGIFRIEAETEPDNGASRRVLEKAGFLPTGVMGEEGPRFALIPGEAVEFRKPVLSDAAEILAFKTEFREHNSGMDGTGILFRSSPEEWLDYNRRMEARDNPNIVPSLQYGLFRKENGRLLGLIQLRLELKGYLLEFGGNIGYCVRPSERRKGYARQMLRRGLEICRREGLDRVLITCLEDNTGSARTIESCGGVLESIVLDDKNYLANMKRYWIAL